MLDMFIFVLRKHFTVKTHIKKLELKKYFLVVLQYTVAIHSYNIFLIFLSKLGLCWGKDLFKMSF